MRPAVFVCLALAMAGCRGKRLSPEQYARALVAEMEQGVEEKDLKRVARLVSERYRDKEGNDRQTVLGLLRVQIIRYPAIHLLVRVSAVDVPVATQARATVFAAMASVPLGAPSDLPRAAADLYRFDIELGDDGKNEWRLTNAAWAPARPEDFF